MDGKVIAAIIAIALLFGGGIWWGVTHNWGCPKGQQLVVTGYYPATHIMTDYKGRVTGSYVSMDPIYACEVTNG